MTKSNQKKGQNYIPFFESTHPEMQRKTSSCQGGLQLSARAARASPAPCGRGAPAARQSGATGGQGGLRPRIRAARVPLAPRYLFLNLHTLKCKENIYLE